MPWALVKRNSVLCTNLFSLLVPMMAWLVTASGATQYVQHLMHPLHLRATGSRALAWRLPAAAAVHMPRAAFHLTFHWSPATQAASSGYFLLRSLFLALVAHRLPCRHDAIESPGSQARPQDGSSNLATSKAQTARNMLWDQAELYQLAGRWASLCNASVGPMHAPVLNADASVCAWKQRSLA